eukprot:973587-Pelagomonas_calceolata.AAC.4
MSKGVMFVSTTVKGCVHNSRGVALPQEAIAQTGCSAAAQFPLCSLPSSLPCASSPLQDALQLLHGLQSAMPSRSLSSSLPPPASPALGQSMDSLPTASAALADGVDGGKVAASGLQKVRCLTVCGGEELAGRMVVDLVCAAKGGLHAPPHFSVCRDGVGHSACSKRSYVRHGS